MGCCLLQRADAARFSMDLCNGSSASIGLLALQVAGLSHASGIGAVPSNLAWLRSQEAAGGARAHRGDGRANLDRDACGAARALCSVREAERRVLLWIW